jgi:hypothetical protein
MRVDVKLSPLSSPRKRGTSKHGPLDKAQLAPTLSRTDYWVPASAGTTAGDTTGSSDRDGWSASWWKVSVPTLNQPYWWVNSESVTGESALVISRRMRWPVDAHYRTTAEHVVNVLDHLPRVGATGGGRLQKDRIKLKT